MKIFQLKVLCWQKLRISWHRNTSKLHLGFVALAKLEGEETKPLPGGVPFGEMKDFSPRGRFDKSHQRWLLNIKTLWGRTKTPEEPFLVRRRFLATPHLPPPPGPQCPQGTRCTPGDARPLRPLTLGTGQEGRRGQEEKNAAATSAVPAQRSRTGTRYGVGGTQTMGSAGPTGYGALGLHQEELTSLVPHPGVKVSYCSLWLRPPSPRTRVGCSGARAGR